MRDALNDEVALKAFFRFSASEHRTKVQSLCELLNSLPASAESISAANGSACMLEIAEFCQDAVMDSISTCRQQKMEFELAIISALFLSDSLLLCRPSLTGSFNSASLFAHRNYHLPRALCRRLSRGSWPSSLSADRSAGDDIAKTVAKAETVARLVSDVEAIRRFLASEMAHRYLAFSFSHAKWERGCRDFVDLVLTAVEEGQSCKSLLRQEGLSALLDWILRAFHDVPACSGAGVAIALRSLIDCVKSRSNLLCRRLGDTCVSRNHFWKELTRLNEQLPFVVTNDERFYDFLAARFCDDSEYVTRYWKR